LDAIQAFLIQRGMKTLGIRMERHNSNAVAIAEFLKEHSKVISVMYPGLTDDKYHSIGKKNLRGYGGMLSFRVKGGLEGARKFLSSLEYVAPAPSLGGVESLTTLPVDTSHASASAEDRKEIGVTDDMVRFSTGIEDVDDILEDIGQALGQLS
jgi:cystathionine beta-lyase/cystathionine gamma-synthase